MNKKDPNNIEQTESSHLLEKYEIRHFNNKVFIKLFKLTFKMILKFT